MSVLLKHVEQHYERVAFRQKTEGGRSTGAGESDSAVRLCGLTACFLRVVQSCAAGREQLLPSLVQFAVRALVSSHERTSDEISELGVAVLCSVFQTSEMARADILEHLFGNMLVDPVHSSRYISAFARVIEQATLHMLPQSTRLKEIFDHLCVLPLGSARALLHAVAPLLRLDPSLYDYLVLVLRKSLFSQHVGVRCAALEGILALILRTATARARSDQPTSSQVAPNRSPDNLTEEQQRAYELLCRCLSFLLLCLLQCILSEFWCSHFLVWVFAIRFPCLQYILSWLFPGVFQPILSVCYPSRVRFRSLRGEF
jgi:FANCI solenoid 2